MNHDFKLREKKIRKKNGTTHLCSSVNISVVPIKSGMGKSRSNEPVANNDAFR